MSAKSKLLRLSLLAFAAFAATGVHAQEISMPEAVQGKTADQVQAMPESSGASFVIGHPKEDQVDEKGLIYRDPSLPLTIGEMAEMQKERQIKDFLKKSGFTTEKPPAPPPVVDVKAPERIESVLTVKSILAWEEGRPFAEISNGEGAILKVENGFVVSKRVSVIYVDGRQVTLAVKPELPRECNSKIKAKAKKKTCDPTPSFVVLKAGDQFRWFD